MRSLHLASASSRRVEILKSLGLVFTAAGLDLDERRLADETAAAMVVRLATAKANAARDTAAVVIGADTAVVVDGAVFGKPADREDALQMLAQLSGRAHRVLTGVAVCADDTVRTGMSSSTVQFRDIDPDEARAYWHSGEPVGKAGAYAIQGLGGSFVSELTGSYSGVVGLPVFETAALLAAAGISVIARAGEA